MRPATGAASTWGLASIVCGGGAFAMTVLAIAPFVGCLATPLAGLCALGALVLGIVAIVDGSKRGDAAERLRGIVGVTLGVSLPLVVGVAVAFLSRTAGNTLYTPPPTPAVAPADAGR